jgi:mono/diheme cytochrome c family protein
MRFVIAMAALAATVATAGAEGTPNGKGVYDTRCAFCHGQKGKGDGPAGAALHPAPTNFATRKYWQSADAKRLKAIIKLGKPGTAMVPFGHTLSETEIDEVLAYMRTFAGR